jgi:hypothetical protein
MTVMGIGRPTSTAGRCSSALHPSSGAMRIPAANVPFSFVVVLIVMALLSISEQLRLLEPP